MEFWSQVEYLIDTMRYWNTPFPKRFGLLITFAVIMLDYLMSLILLSTWYCNFFWLGEWGEAYQDTLSIITFLLEHTFMLKRYSGGGGGWVVAHNILLSAQVPMD